MCRDGRLLLFHPGCRGGNLAVKFLATGGVYIAGGVATHTLPLIKEPAFMQRFKRKGRFAEFISRIPLHRVVTPARVGGCGRLRTRRSGTIPSAQVASDFRRIWMRILVIDVGGTHVKVLVTGEREPWKVVSGPSLAARRIVARASDHGYPRCDRRHSFIVYCACILSANEVNGSATRPRFPKSFHPFSFLRGVGAGPGRLLLCCCKRL